MCFAATTILYSGFFDNNSAVVRPATPALREVRGRLFYETNLPRDETYPTITTFFSVISSSWQVSIFGHFELSYRAILLALNSSCSCNGEGSSCSDHTQMSGFRLSVSRVDQATNMPSSSSRANCNRCQKLEKGCDWIDKYGWTEKSNFLRCMV